MRCRLLLLHWRALWLSFSITLAIMQVCNFPLASTACPCELNFLEGRHHSYILTLILQCSLHFSVESINASLLPSCGVLTPLHQHFSLQSETWLQNYSRVTACLRWQQEGGFRVWRLRPFCVDCAGSPFTWTGSVSVIGLSPEVQTCLWSV